MSWSRRAGSFTRQRRRTLVTFAGNPAGSASQPGSSLITAARISDTVSPPNGRCAVSISNSSTPKAQTSARLSTARPRACSGDM
jgi:hypothetical protein